MKFRTKNKLYNLGSKSNANSVQKIINYAHYADEDTKYTPKAGNNSKIIHYETNKNVDPAINLSCMCYHSPK